MLKSILAFCLTRRAIIVLGLFMFAGREFSLSKSDIEAYPNPAPVILEITAQRPASPRRRWSIIIPLPWSGALYDPGIANIRSTSFYGLSFVRVTFKYGVDYFFAYSQTAISLQQTSACRAHRSRKSSSPVRWGKSTVIRSSDLRILV